LPRVFGGFADLPFKKESEQVQLFKTCKEDLVEVCAEEASLLKKQQTHGHDQAWPK
jgi:hypothetical protein